MADKINPILGEVVRGKQPKPQIPQTPKNPIAGKVLPGNPNVKPETPMTPLAGKVVPPKKKLPLVTTSLALILLGIGATFYYKFKNNNSENTKK